MIVIKQDAFGKEITRYPAEELLHLDDTSVCLRARFTLERMSAGPLTLCPGDVFTEWYYTERWYNVFRVDDARSTFLKGWYCNFTRPARLQAGRVSAEDLALDMIVLPTREIFLLDEDEYAALPLSGCERNAVETASREVRQLVANGAHPFRERETL